MAGSSETVQERGSASAARPLLIIGSGSTGLALAQGLRQAGIPCVVFEKHAPGVRERDWSMGLHWGAPMLQSLMPNEMWQRLQTVQADPSTPTKDQDTITFVHGKTGEPIRSVAAERFHRLRRSKLRELLSKGIDIRYEKRLSDVAFAMDGNSVTANFSDGTSITGSMLIGADGARSTTRQLLLADAGAVHKIPYCATFVQRKFTKEQAIFLRSFHPLFLAAAHPDNLFGFFSTQSVENEADPSTWTFSFYISWPSSLKEQAATSHWADAQRLAQQKMFARNFCEPWRSAYEWTPDNAPVWYMSMTDWDPSLEEHRWNNHGGLVTMVGDAVHPMSYQRGQGLNHSITDAGHLRDTLVAIRNGADRAKSITAFEDTMIKRSGAEVRDGTANTMLLHDWEKVEQSPAFARGMKAK